MTEIRSYRRVFDLERRIYRIDRLRLNPGGVPVRGIVYFLGLIALSLTVGGLPLLSAAARAVPWYLRDLLLPGASAAVLSMIRIEGRSFHLAALALARYRIRHRGSAGACRYATTGGRWAPNEILILPDGSDARMRPLRYTGPGAALIAVEHELAGPMVERGAGGFMRRGRRPRLVLREVQGARTLERGRVISIGPGVRLLVRSQERKARR